MRTDLSTGLEGRCSALHDGVNGARGVHGIAIVRRGSGGKVRPGLPDEIAGQTGGDYLVPPAGVDS